MQPVKIGRAYEGSLTYLHKIKAGRNIYLFSNSTDRPVDAPVLLRDSLDLSLWNPMNGEIRPLDETYIRSDSGLMTTQVSLRLDPVNAVFLVEEP